MQKWMTCAFSVVTLALAVTVFAEKGKPIGKHSKEDVRKACNANGGELLGVSEYGSYGCEYDSGVLILCDKKTNCTAWEPLKIDGDRKHLLDAIGLPTKPTVTSK